MIIDQPVPLRCVPYPEVRSVEVCSSLILRMASVTEGEAKKTMQKGEREEFFTFVNCKILLFGPLEASFSFLFVQRQYLAVYTKLALDL